MVDPRYQITKDSDQSWSIIDTAIDERRSDNRIMMGLSKKHGKVIVGALNRSMVSVDEAGTSVVA
jgi:hypothetical protein